MEESALLLDKASNGNSTPSSASENGTTTNALKKISPTVYFLRGDESKQQPATAPSAILLFAWMGAPLRHMTKFIDYYSKSHFPGSPIILVLSPTNEYMAKKSIRQKALQPAASLFQSLNVSHDRVLVHTFSNGGINALRTFLSCLQGETTFEPKMLVIDSAPGTSSLGGATNAFTAHIKSRIWKYLMRFVVGVLYILLVIRETILRRQPMLEEMRSWLTDGNAIGKKTRLVYLYSEKDELVERKSVESNIRDMRDRGYEVRSRNFGASRHVGHMRANPELYWSEILGVWKE
jgi:hypothetical protein